LEKSKSALEEVWVTSFTEESAQEFREHVIEHAKHDHSKPIVIYIDSFGGHVDALAKMIETLDEVPNHIITVCMGKAMSAGAILLSHGDTRFCGRNSRVMVHEISSGTQGDVHDIYADAMAVKRMNEKFMGLLAKNCKIKGGYKELRKRIKSQDGRDRHMNAQEALKFGIIDVVGTPRLITDYVHRVVIIPDKKKKRKNKN
jgi:ATP-dependent Clp protease protease subunit